MIALDTSAILAILWDEPEAAAFKGVIADAEAVLISTATLLEAHIVCSNRKGAANVQEMERLLEILSVVIVPFDDQQLALAREAHDRFASGRHGLNYGDCFSYALAKSRDLPLLFKGDDFAATDVKRAV